jgi:hypothetical protein
MYNLRPDLVQLIKSAKDLEELKTVLLQVLSLMAADHDRLFAADKAIREAVGIPHPRL